jgi:hypothetical protein
MYQIIRAIYKAAIVAKTIFFKTLEEKRINSDSNLLLDFQIFIGLLLCFQIEHLLRCFFRRKPRSSKSDDKRCESDEDKISNY